jgi:hypothetical protein
MSLNQTTTSSTLSNEYLNGILTSKNVNGQQSQTHAISPYPYTASSFFQISIDDLRINLDNNNKNVEEEDECIEEEFVDSNAENQAIIEISIDCKLLENDCDLIIYSNTMQKCIYEKLSQNIIPIYLYAIIDNQINQKV